MTKKINLNITNRDPNDLDYNFMIKVLLWMEDVNTNTNSKIFITEGHRTLARQKHLYAQGRTRAGPKVTWTLKSLHRNGLAVDIAFRGLTLYPGMVKWREVADIGKKYGIDRLFDLHKRDKPHFQDNGKPLSLTDIIMENFGKYIKIMEKEVPEDQRIYSSYNGDKAISEKDTKALVTIAVHRLRKILNK